MQYYSIPMLENREMLIVQPKGVNCDIWDYVDSMVVSLNRQPTQTHLFEDDRPNNVG